MSRDTVEIIHELRMQLAKRGQAAMRTLALAFKINDRDKSGFFDFEEFEAILGKAGLFLKRQELSTLFKYFDRNGDERISYNEFLKGVQGPLSQRRTAMIRKAFEKMDVDKSGVIDMKDIAATYNAAKHPKVVSGERTKEEAFTEFLHAFEGDEGNRDGKVTWDEFLNYYSGISASIPYNDDYFVLMMEKAWGITEDASGVASVPQSLLRKIENVLREKIRQKTVPTKAETETLRLAFKHFDIDDSGQIIYAEFCYALERFGIVLEENVSRALFNEFDKNGNGRINYAEFCAVLYQNDPLAAVAAPTLTSSQTLPAASAQAADSGRQYAEDGKVLIAASAPAEANGGPTVDVVFVLGGPGSGKTLMSGRIAQEFGWQPIFVGQLLQDESQRDSKEAQEINQAVQSGQVVPIETTMTVLQRAIEQSVAEGKTKILLDGFPRTAENLQGWTQTLGNLYRVPFALFLDCPQEVMEKRLIATGGARTDAEIQSIRDRLDSYQKQTVPIIKYFSGQNRLRAVSAVPSPDQVYQQVRRVFA